MIEHNNRPGPPAMTASVLPSLPPVSLLRHGRLPRDRAAPGRCALPPLCSAGVAGAEADRERGEEEQDCGSNSEPERVRKVGGIAWEDVVDAATSCNVKRGRAGECNGRHEEGEEAERDGAESFSAIFPCDFCSSTWTHAMTLPMISRMTEVDRDTRIARSARKAAIG